MTVEKARKLLGIKYKNSPDKKIEEIINSLSEFVDILVDITLENMEQIKCKE